MSSLYILDINPLSDIWFANIFFHPVGCLFICWLFLLLCRAFYFDVDPLVYLCFYYLHFLCHIQKIIAKTNVKKAFSLCFLLEVLQFQVLCLGLESFRVNFCKWCRTEVQFHSFAYEYPVCSTPFIEETIFSPLNILLCHILIDHIWDILFLGSWFCSIGLCVCFYASIILLWLLHFCNIVWNQEMWCLQLCSSFSGLLWLFNLFCDSIQI